MSFHPPSLPTNKLKSFTHHQPPSQLPKEPVIMGVDEAGRGPVLGPMVYAVAYTPQSLTEETKTHGWNDSKVLQASARLAMFKEVLQSPLNETVGWATTVMSATDIGSGMLRVNNPYNLNDQAHDTTINLIQLVIDAGVDIAELYVDTVGPADKYQRKLSTRFPSIQKVVVTSKADAIYPIVSLASICAKVTRDLSLEEEVEGAGSGYPSDPNTVRWLEANIDRVFGWGPLVRYSWGTAKNMLESRGVPVSWERRETPRKRTKGLPKVGMSVFGEPYN